MAPSAPAFSKTVAAGPLRVPALRQLQEPGAALDVSKPASHVVDRGEAGCGRVRGRFAQIGDQRVARGAFGEDRAACRVEAHPHRGIAGGEDAARPDELQELAGSAGVVTKLLEPGERADGPLVQARREDQASLGQRPQRAGEFAAEALVPGGLAAVMDEQYVDPGAGGRLAAGELAEDGARQPARFHHRNHNPGGDSTRYKGKHRKRQEMRQRVQERRFERPFATGRFRLLVGHCAVLDPTATVR